MQWELSAGSWLSLLSHIGKPSSQLQEILKGTKGKRLYYGNSPDLHGFCDSYMEHDVDACKTASRYVFKFTISGGAVSQCSMLQNIVALSTTNAEYAHSIL